MREIKFRAWDEETETMYYSDKEYEDCFFGFDKGVMVGWLRQTEPQTRDEPAYDYGKAVNVMQFTGLKDKNGKDLGWWEGDIFARSSDRQTEGIVVYDLGCFWLNRIRGGRNLLYECVDWSMCKIGNIHENPELIK